MTETCTHATCQTAFCPHCGEGVDYGPGHQLLAHIRAYLRTKQLRSESYTEVMGGLDVDSKRMARLSEGLQSLSDSSAKWSTWESWVAAHIAKDAGEGDASEA